MKLRVVQNYNSNTASYQAGQVIDVPDALGEWLMRDSTGSFQVEADPVEDGPVEDEPRKLRVANRAARPRVAK